MRLRKGDRIQLCRADGAQPGWAEWDGECWRGACGEMMTLAIIRWRLHYNHYGDCDAVSEDELVSRDRMLSFMDGWECMAEQLIATGAMRMPR